MNVTPGTNELRLQRRARRGGAGLLARGEPATWLTGGALVACLAMVGGLLALVIVNGLGTFWPGPLIVIRTHDGREIMGEPTRNELYALTPAMLGRMPPRVEELARARMAEAGGESLPDERRLLRTGNFELVNEHFTWVANVEVSAETQPEWGLLVERQKDGNFYGTLVAYLDVERWDSARHQPGEILARDPAATVLVSRARGFAQDRVALSSLTEADTPTHLVTRAFEGPAAAWDAYSLRASEIRLRTKQLLALRKHGLGALARRLESARLATREARRLHGDRSPPHLACIEAERQVAADVAQEEMGVQVEIATCAASNAGHGLFVATSAGQTKLISATDIYRATAPNRLDSWSRLGLFTNRWTEFFTEDPREANSEGGVMPAIFGTVVMTLLMSLAVVPFGVLAALYLREYARAGIATSAVRIAVNNLAGVPSIVFGVFGLGFFCYGFGKYIDGGPAVGLGITPWSAGLWFAGLVVLICTAALGAGMAAFSGAGRRRLGPWARWGLERGAALAWIAASTLVVLLVVHTPHFEGLFRAKLADGQPTFGTGGLLWASLTLALLTLPVVIVATEEALAAVPNSMREGSYACGASKWQTIWRIVLPRAMPGIMTGMILAMARGAGEVAPLMLVGAVKLAPELPIDATAPFVHPERSFMHLGFHIYDLGFQSQNSEAAKPIVYSTTLLLIALIAALNLTAIWLRARLRRKFKGSQF